MIPRRQDIAVQPAFLTSMSFILRSHKNPKIDSPQTASGRADKRSASAILLTWNADDARTDSANSIRILIRTEYIIVALLQFGLAGPL